MSVFDTWKSSWEASLESCRRRGGKTNPLKVSRPSSARELVRIENTLGHPLPTSLAEFFRAHSSEVFFTWHLPTDLIVPEFDGIFCGGLEVSLDSLPELLEGHRGWVNECFPRLDDPYDGVWHNKLSIQAVGNGDELAIDLAAPDGPVVYLSHDEGQGHGYQLGQNFLDFVDRWSKLGCVGAEDWQWLHFVSSPTSGLEPNAPRSLQWRSWFGLPQSDT